MLRIGILASTNATDMQAIIDAISSKKLNAKISVVVGNNKNSFALQRARKHNIKSVFIDCKGKDAESYDKEIAKELDKNKVKIILLIGYMKILSNWFVNKYKNKIMNIHPSLLPAFAKGMNKSVHEHVLKRGCKVTGCTLHFVDETIDGGPIIMQKAVEITEDETVESLKEKVQKAEQEIILKAIDLFEEGRIKLEDDKVKILK